MTDFIYDIEVYPNVFTATFYNADSGKVTAFEISNRVNNRLQLRKYLVRLRDGGHCMVGFNNWFYDYPVIHHFLERIGPTMTAAEITDSLYQKSMQIINTPFNNRWSNTVREYQHFVPQIDLYRIHHFDNPAKSTSLKLLEFNMRSDSIQEMPFDPTFPLEDNQIEALLAYNKHDVVKTYDFYMKSRKMIEFRRVLSDKYGKSFMNHNDTKIGKDYLIMRLQEEGVVCFDEDTRGPRQTKRKSIKLGDVIFDYIKFERPEFRAVLNWFKDQTIKSTKGVFSGIPPMMIGPELEQYCNMSGPKGTVKNLNCVIDGFQFDFGTGGIHGSVEPMIIDEDDEHAIIDIDVTSLYPSIGIVNNVFPEHLTKKFCSIYAEIKKERMKYKKGTVENSMFKLALNGVYGDSNNEYSPFYDPQYTMTITINGQLMLSMLAEQVMKVPDLKILQINTDGITMYLPRSQVKSLHDVMFNWEILTGLDLEEAHYKRMAIRDVNNYIAQYTNGNVKRKSAYEYEMEWHQDQSALVVAKAAEAALIHDADIGDFIRRHNDDYDFFLRTKVPRSSRLEFVDENELHVEIVQNISRYYYVTEGGGWLVKVMPPLKGQYKERRIGMNSGRDKLVRSNRVWSSPPVVVSNDSVEIDRSRVAYDWYIEEANKLVEPLLRNDKRA